MGQLFVIRQAGLAILANMNSLENGCRVGALILCFFLSVEMFLFGQQLNTQAQSLQFQKSAVQKRTEVVRAALDQVGVTLAYDPAYVKITYPNGDVPMDRGVCTDVVIRALRRVGVDLQMLVHEDKKQFPGAYAHNGAACLLDANIDHRRVPNLMTFFHRQKRDVIVTHDGTDYLPGDIVVWRLPSGLLHVGVVTDHAALGANRPLMVHNIGNGAQCEDTLFAFTLVGHYRWFM